MSLVTSAQGGSEIGHYLHIAPDVENNILNSYANKWCDVLKSWLIVNSAEL